MTWCKAAAIAECSKLLIDEVIEEKVDVVDTKGCVTSFVAKTKTLYKLDNPSSVTWLVAHNGKDIAHVLEVPQGCACLTGLGTLEKCLDQKAAADRAKVFGWKAEERLDVGALAVEK